MLLRSLRERNLSFIKTGMEHDADYYLTLFQLNLVNSAKFEKMFSTADIL